MGSPGATVDRAGMVMWGRSGAGACESRGGKSINPSLVCLRLTVLCLEKARAHRGIEADPGAAAISSGRGELQNNPI